MSTDIDLYTSITDQPIIGFEIRRFNWRLRKAREALGWSRAELARQAGVSPSTVGEAEMLHSIGASSREKIAFTLNIPEDDLFPGEIDALLNAGPSKIEIPLSTPHLLSLTEGDVVSGTTVTEDEVARLALRQDLNRTMMDLTPRERAILEQRFGLDDGHCKDLAEIGNLHGITRERVRQIEEKALRKMRHPTRTRTLRTWLGESAPRRARPPYSPSNLPTRPERTEACERGDGETCNSFFGAPDPQAVARGNRGRPIAWCKPCWEYEVNEYVREYNNLKQIRDSIDARTRARYADITITAEELDDDDES